MHPKDTPPPPPNGGWASTPRDTGGELVHVTVLLMPWLTKAAEPAPKP